MKFDKNKESKFLVDISKEYPQKIHVFSGGTLINEIDLKKYYTQEKVDSIHQEIFENYKEKGYSDNILEQIQANIDPGVYMALKSIDETTGTTRKAESYVDTMLRYYRIKTNETPEEYARRVAENKRELLANHDIEIQYNTGLFGMKETAPYEKAFKGKSIPTIKRATSSIRNLRFSRFASESDLELKVVDKSELRDDLKDILDSIKEEPEQAIGGFLHRNPSKERTHIMGLPKGWGKRRKEEKEKKPSVFRKAVLGVMIFATVAGVAIGVRGCSTNKTTDSPTYSTEQISEDLEDSTETELDYNADDNIIVIPKSTDDSTEETLDESTISAETEVSELEQDTPSETEIENNDETQTEVGDEETATETQEETPSENSKNETSENATIDSTALLKNLMCYSGVGFNTEFQMSEGTYYETPEGTGASGHYANYSSSNVKINRIDILKDGVYYKTITTGDFSEILEQYLDDSSYTFSFHVQSVDGTTLGWDNSEALQKAVLTQYISNLDISQETKDTVLSTISQGKNITPDQLNEILNQLPSKGIER